MRGAYGLNAFYETTAALKGTTMRKEDYQTMLSAQAAHIRTLASKIEQLCRDVCALEEENDAMSEMISELKENNARLTHELTVERVLTELLTLT